MPWSMLIASKPLWAALPCSLEASGFRSPNCFSPRHSCHQPASNPEWMRQEIESFSDSSWYLNITKNIIQNLFPGHTYTKKNSCMQICLKISSPLAIGTSLFLGGSVDQWDQPPRANSTHASTKVEMFLASREAKKQEATRSQMLYHYFTSIFASSVSVSMLIT